MTVAKMMMSMMNDDYDDFEYDEYDECNDYDGDYDDEYDEYNDYDSDYDDEYDDCDDDGESSVFDEIYDMFAGHGKHEGSGGNSKPGVSNKCSGHIGHGECSERSNAGEDDSMKRQDRERETVAEKSAAETACGKKKGSAVGSTRSVRDTGCTGSAGNTGRTYSMGSTGCNPGFGIAPADPGEFSITFDDVYGYEPVKNALCKICDMAKVYAKYERLGARMPHGVLLSGKPGVGKTMMARALIHELARPAYVLRKTEGGSAFIDTIGDVFSAAKENAPSVVLLDDLDRYSSGEGCTQEFAAVQAGIDSVQNAEVLVIATVNETRRLPASLVRSGRFDRKIEMDVPEIDEAPEIIARFLKGRRVAPDINTKTVAKLLDGYTCASLDSVLNDATLNAVYAGREEIHMEDLVSAILAGIYGVDDTVPVSTEEKADTAYHEAGHAAASVIMHPGCVAIASIRSCKSSSQGFVKTLRYTDSSYETLRRDVMETLAGRAALEIKFSRKDTGCSSDIRRAIYIITDLVGDNCVSGFRFADFSGGFVDGHNSDKEIHDKHMECVRIMESCYDEVRTLLFRNWPLVESIAKGLMEKGTLICDDLDKIVNESIQPGMQQSVQSQPNIQQGIQQGVQSQPNIQQGIQQGTQPGMPSDIQAGIQPDIQPGMPSDIQAGIQPDIQAGIQPDSNTAGIAAAYSAHTGKAA